MLHCDAALISRVLARGKFVQDCLLGLIVTRSVVNGPSGPVFLDFRLLFLIPVYCACWGLDFSFGRLVILRWKIFA